MVEGATMEGCGIMCSSKPLSLNDPKYLTSSLALSSIGRGLVPRRRVTKTLNMWPSGLCARQTPKLPGNYKKGRPEAIG